MKTPDFCKLCTDQGVEGCQLLSVGERAALRGRIVIAHTIEGIAKTGGIFYAAGEIPTDGYGFVQAADQTVAERSQRIEQCIGDHRFSQADGYYPFRTSTPLEG